jgi:hypothetical protein
MDLSQIVFAPIIPFVGHPERISVVALMFWTLFWLLQARRRYWSWPLLWTAGFWTAFALWEWLVLLQEADIRVDLLLIYPILVGVTTWGLWAGLRPCRNRIK